MFFNQVKTVLDNFNEFSPLEYTNNEQNIFNWMKINNNGGI